MSFVVYAIGRCRSAWLSEFLCYGDWDCRHEQAIYMRSIEDFQGLLSRPNTGIVETAASYGWRLIEHYFPGITKAVIQRPVDEVVRSMMEIDFKGQFEYDETALRKSISYGARMLDEISRQPGVLTVTFADLEREDACAAIFEHCLGLPFDRKWWEFLAHRDVQMDVPDLMHYYHENKADVDAFKALCKTELRRLAKIGAVRKEALHGVN
jgi:hypothetical protein